MSNRSSDRLRAGALLSAVAGVALVALAGCGGKSLTRDYAPAARLPDAPGVERLALRLGHDARPLGGRTSLGKGFLALIPLVPWGTQRLDPHVGAFNEYPGEGGFPGEVAQTIARDLEGAGIARVVAQSAELLPGQAPPPPSHELQITVTEGVYDRRLTLYGVSFAGALLWFVGAPTSFGDAQLAFDVVVRDPSGATVAQRSFRAEEGAVELLYRPAQRAYPAALIEAYERISPELRAFVADAVRPRAAHAP